MNMTKKQKQTAIILGIAIVVLTVIVFVIPFHKGGTFWVAYISELLAIALQIPIFKLAYDNADDLKSKVLGFPIFRVGYIYLGVQTIASVILFALGGIFQSFPIWISIVLCMLILAFAIVGSIAADIAREEVTKIEEVQHVDTRFIKEMRIKSQNLVGRTNNTELKKKLESLAEDFKYSDPVSSDAIKDYENKISAKISVLEEYLSADDYERAEKVCVELKQILSDRNAACKLNKRG